MQAPSLFLTITRALWNKVADRSFLKYIVHGAAVVMRLRLVETGDPQHIKWGIHANVGKQQTAFPNTEHRESHPKLYLQGP